MSYPCYISTLVFGKGKVMVTQACVRLYLLMAQEMSHLQYKALQRSNDCHISRDLAMLDMNVEHGHKRKESGCLDLLVSSRSFSIEGGKGWVPDTEDGGVWLGDMKVRWV